jgi:hypothetical protein
MRGKCRLGAVSTSTRQADPRQSARSLAIVASRGSPVEANHAWESLLERFPFDQLPHEVIRALPQIYLNLRQHGHVAEMPRLRGVYRAFWSGNLLLISACRSVLLDLRDEEVPHRVIKGCAISAIAGNWGSRRMGDVDVVVPDSHIGAAVDILHSRGFKQKVVEEVEQGRGERARLGSYVSSEGGQIDLHSPGGYPRVFSELFRESGRVAQLLDTPLITPSLELSFAIAVWHGVGATASSDEMQTLLDISSLIPLVDLGVTRQLLVQSDLAQPTRLFLTQLERCGVVDTHRCQFLGRRTFGEHVVHLTERGRRITDAAKRASALPKVLRRRKLGVEDRRGLRSLPGFRARVYEAWNRLGQLRALERFIHLRLRGFGDLGPEGGPIPERDFRAFLPVARGVPRRLTIHLEFEAPTHPPVHRLLFIDGRLHGTVPLPGNVAGIYEITPERDFVEVSARHPSSVTRSKVRRARIDWV